jgi:hypothetical protein
MSIKKYIATQDNTLTNAYEENLTTRATASNLGACDIMEIFSIYGQVTSSNPTKSTELSRALIRFPVSKISSDRTAGNIPASGSVNFVLRLYHAESSQTTPANATYKIKPVAQSWEEGFGTDIHKYEDISTDITGSNWIYAAFNPAAKWSVQGGSVLAASEVAPSPQYATTLSDGDEDFEIDITSLVEEWVAGNISNYGLMVKLTSTQEGSASAENPIYSNPTGSTISYYTKRIFARTSQYYYKRPSIEARWDDSRQDDRGNFYYSSSLANGPDNLNTIYLYNYVRGRLTNIPNAGTGNDIFVSLYSGSSNNTEPSGSKLKFYDGKQYVTGGYVSTGIYSASICITGNLGTASLTRLFDVWTSGETGSVQYFTSSIGPVNIDAGNNSNRNSYVTSVENMKSEFRQDEKYRFRVFVREKNWNPNIYTKANASVKPYIIESGSYRVFRIADNFDVVSYATGSTKYTKLSYDVSGSYFELNFDIFEKNYQYGVKLAYYNSYSDSYEEQSEVFKFRVV